MLIVDAQIHLWSGPSAPPHHRQAPYLPGQAVADMDAAGVDRAVNCPAAWDPDSNTLADDAARRFPDRLATMGWFSLDDAPDRGRVAAHGARPGLLGLRFLLVTPAQHATFSDGGFDWIFADAETAGLPVAMAMPPALLPQLGELAHRYPSLRLMVDHLGAGAGARMPAAFDHLALLLDLARFPNIAVKATGMPAYASDAYPFRSTHEVLRRAFDAFGPDRFFWGTDITRLPCSWRESVAMFVDDLDWLDGADAQKVMGEALCDWLGWLPVGPADEVSKRC